MSDELRRLGPEVWHIYLLLDRSASVPGLRAKTGLSESTVRRHLATLQEHGLVDSEDGASTTLYRRAVTSGDVPLAPAPVDVAASGSGAGVAVAAAPSNRDRLASPRALALWTALLLVLAGSVLAFTALQRGEREVGTASLTTPSSGLSSAPASDAATDAGGASDDKTSRTSDTLQLESFPYAGKPLETIPVRGTYADAPVGTTLRLQRREAGRWVNFPLPTATDENGKFTTYVELGARGRYRLRVSDPDNGAVSDAVVLRID